MDSQKWQEAKDKANRTRVPVEIGGGWVMPDRNPNPYVQANYDCKCGYRFYLIGSHVELPAVCPRCHQEVEVAYWWDNVPESEANPYVHVKVDDR